MRLPSSLPLQSISQAKSLREKLLVASLSAAIGIFVQFQATKPGGWAPETVRVSGTAYRQILEAVGDRPVVDLTCDDTDRVMVAAYSGGYSPQWSQVLRGKWVVFCRWLVRVRVLPTDISVSWEPISIGADEHSRVYHDYTEAEIGKLCEHLSAVETKFVWGACLAGGLRLANHRSLSWSKITEDWVIVIPAGEMKGRKEMRWPVCSRLRKILGPRGSPGDLVYGKLPCESKLIEHLKRASRKVGLDPRWSYPHQFRRTCCAWLKAAGVTRDEAMRLFGWTSEDLILRHYWPRETDDDRRAILDKMA